MDLVHRIGRLDLIIDPCIPKKWTEYEMRYRYQDTVYEIKVHNSEGVSRGVKSISVDGKVYDGNILPLLDDKGIHKVEVRMGK